VLGIGAESRPEWTDARVRMTLSAKSRGGDCHGAEPAVAKKAPPGSGLYIELF